MPKEPYVKPEVKSEIIEAEALGCSGSPGGTNFMLKIGLHPSANYCCEE